jgi:hypothetical protein
MTTEPSNDASGQPQTIQDHQEIISQHQSAIDTLNKEIAASRSAIVELIKSEQTTGDPITDLVYLLGCDPVEHSMLGQSLSRLSTALLSNKGELVVFESIHTESGRIVFGLKSDELRLNQTSQYFVGLLDLEHVFPLLYQSKLASSADEPMIRIRCRIREGSQPLHLRFDVLFHFLSNAVLLTGESAEPSVIVTKTGKLWRYWIGNGAVLTCLRRIFNREEKQKLSVEIRALLQQEGVELSENDYLAIELGLNVKPVDHAAT